MADYSRMSYEELRTIADNDSIADSMSDEEYESLSNELWRKFSVERLAAEPKASPVAVASNQDNRSTIWSTFNNLRKGCTLQADYEELPTERRTPRSQQMRGLFGS